MRRSEPCGCRACRRRGRLVAAFFDELAGEIAIAAEDAEGEALLVAGHGRHGAAAGQREAGGTFPAIAKERDETAAIPEEVGADRRREVDGRPVNVALRRIVVEIVILGS